MTVGQQQMPDVWERGDWVGIKLSVVGQTILIINVVFCMSGKWQVFCISSVRAQATK